MGIYLNDGVIVDNLGEEGTDERIAGSGGVNGLHLETFHRSFEVLKLQQVIKGEREVVKLSSLDK